VRAVTRSSISAEVSSSGRFAGGRLAKTLQALLLFAVVVAILFIWVFPAVAPHLPFEDVTIEPTTGATS